MATEKQSIEAYVIENNTDDANGFVFVVCEQDLLTFNTQSTGVMKQLHELRETKEAIQQGTANVRNTNELLANQGIGPMDTLEDAFDDACTKLSSNMRKTLTFRIESASIQDTYFTK